MIEEGPINGFIIDYFGPRVTITIGLICCTVSCLWIALFTFSSNYWWLMPGYTIMGCGLSFVLSTGTVSTINLIPAHDRSSAMGIILGSRQLGSTLGVAIIGLIIVETQMVYLSIFRTVLCNDEDNSLQYDSNPLLMVM